MISQYLVIISLIISIVYINTLNTSLRIDIPSLHQYCSFPSYHRGCFYNTSFTHTNISSCTFSDEYTHFIQSGGRIKGVLIHLCIPASVCMSNVTKKVGSQFFTDIRVTILSWYKYFNQVPKYPWVIFTFSQSVAELRYFISGLSSRLDTDELIRIESIDRLYNDSIYRKPDHIRQYVDCALKFTPTYRAMNEFFSYGMFTHPSLIPFDYWMRIDVDSPLVAPLCDDPFYYIHSHKLTFLTLPYGLLNSDCHQGLMQYFMKYLNEIDIDLNPWSLFRYTSHEKNIIRGNCSLYDSCRMAVDKDSFKGYLTSKDSSSDNKDVIPGFPGCVGVGKFSWYRSPLYMNFAMKVADDDYFMTHRWSDQAMYYLGAVLSEHTKNGSIDILRTTAIHFKFRNQFIRCITKLFDDFS